MISDDRLQRLLRSVFPPVGDTTPSRDRWPLVARRLQAPVGWMWLDIGLAAAVAIVLAIFPQWLSLLAYQL